MGGWVAECVAAPKLSKQLLMTVMLKPRCMNGYSQYPALTALQQSLACIVSVHHCSSPVGLPPLWVSHSRKVPLSLGPCCMLPCHTPCCQQELDPAAASLIRGLAASQAAAGAAPITLIDGLAVHRQYLQPLLPHPEVPLTSWVAKVHALCWVTSFQQVGRGAQAGLARAT
mgnify:CR=1 FL=1